MELFRGKNPTESRLKPIVEENVISQRCESQDSVLCSACYDVFRPVDTNVDIGPLLYVCVLHYLKWYCFQRKPRECLEGMFWDRHIIGLTQNKNNTDKD